ncbi:MAG: hypothetical protein OEU32_08715 [Acidimicrobiia bacterium]|nr:hypothetical protein [Acidimicrobiia bacterium]
MPSDDLPGLEDDDAAVEPPEPEVYDDWTDADWARWFDEEARGSGDDNTQLTADEFRFVAEILQLAVNEDEAPRIDDLGNFSDLLQADDLAWKFSKLPTAKRERLFHLFYDKIRVDRDPVIHEQRTWYDRWKKWLWPGAAIAVGAAIAIPLLVVGGGDDSAETTPDEVAAPTDNSAPEPDAEPAIEEGSPDETDEGIGDPDEPATTEDAPAPDPEPPAAAPSISVIHGSTPEGSFQVQVLDAPAYESATGSYELDVTVTNEQAQEFVVDGEFTDTATYASSTFDAEGNQIPDATATAEFFDGGIFMEFLTPGYSVPATVVDAEIIVVIDGTTVVILGSSTDTSATE